jgi:hypothetical protein
MSIRVEVFVADGIAVGVVPRAAHLREVLESGAPLEVNGSTWHGLDGASPRPAGPFRADPDDVFLATAEEATDFPVHAQWHDITIEAGPYRIVGQMPTLPGFDPGRALARPTGEFVQLRDVGIGLLGEPPGMSRPMALVNRYVVDRVEADLMLTFFFPGAAQELPARPDASEPAAAADTAAQPGREPAATTA